jgi:hypothetical protein
MCLDGLANLVMASFGLAKCGIRAPQFIYRVYVVHGYT